MTQHSQASSQAYNAFYQICAEAGSDVVAEENAALSIGREFLPEFAIKVLDKVELTPREEREYYEWLTESVQTAINEQGLEVAAGHEWHSEES